MKFRTIFTGALFVLLIAASASAGDGMHSVSKAVDHFAQIGAALAADTTDGVATHASEWLTMMREAHGEEMQNSDHAADHDHAAMQAHMNMMKSLEVLAGADLGLAEAREAYMSLSKDFIPMAQAMYAPEEGDPTWAVMNCGMAKAQWIQVEGATANPYYGSKMLRCGNKVATLTASTGHSCSMKGHSAGKGSCCAGKGAAESGGEKHEHSGHGSHGR